MSWEISKQFNACYGHRVFTQETNEEFALNRPPKCRHIHGHEGEIHVHLSAEELHPSEHMVTDFCNLGWLKKFIDDVIDHKFIFGKDDPYFGRLLLKANLLPVYVPDTEYLVGHVFDLQQFEGKDVHHSDIEIAEGYFVVGFVPTSENLSKWMYDLVQAKMSRIGVNVSKVTWWETPKSQSTYTGE